MKKTAMALVRRFLDETAGVVTMEYTILGVFAVAVCVVGVMIVGLTNSWNLSWVTNGGSGSTVAVEGAQKALRFTKIDVMESNVDYFKNVVGDQTGSMGHKEEGLGDSIGLKFAD